MCGLHEFVARGNGVIMCCGDSHVAIVVFAVNKEAATRIIDEVVVAAVKVVAA